MKRSNILFIVEVGMMSGLAYLLDLVASFLSLRLWPQGGSISIAMVPVFIMSFRWGLKGGMFTGFLLGLLQVTLGPAYVVHPIQAFLDYFVAFTVVGLAGVVYKQIQRLNIATQKKQLLSFIFLGAFIASLARYITHTIAGFVFFAEAGSTKTQALIFSAIYNGTYMLPAFLISAIICYIIINMTKQRFLTTP
ncbi:energy-coupled thiamine transporter ThiT [Metabacillus iocasae]|uniref:Thiamine transporter n=1 Tax=Priestia iocasae TaxID=2291674 RepID=A0ABS2QZ27_9BACI|nr:energy-coupled thiamine transporter ThiT [Metabacillus iocasae]MBM7704672.1 thiamine transporter [Metabacillus iocasae]